MKLFLRVLIIFLLFNSSCSDDTEVLETPKIEALEFLNNNSISVSKGHSSTFEMLRGFQGLDGYNGVDVSHYFEAKSDYSFRFISEGNDCSYFEPEESFTMIVLSNLTFEDLYFTDIDSMQFTNRTYEDPLTSDMVEFYELALFVNREVVNFNEFYSAPGLITSTSTSNLCNFDLDDLVEPFSTRSYYLDAIRLTSDDQNELIKFHENIKILAEL